MAIAYDALGGTNGAAASGPIQWNHTCISTDNVIILVFINISDTSADISGVTHDGNAMTEIWNVLDTGRRTAAYYKVGSGSGAKQISISLSDTVDYFAVISVSFTGVDQSTPMGSYDLDAMSYGTTFSNSVASASGEVVVDSLRVDRKDGSCDESQTYIGMNNYATVSIYASYKAGDTSVTMEWTVEASAWGFLGLIPLKPAAGGATAVPEYYLNYLLKKKRTSWVYSLFPFLTYFDSTIEYIKRMI